MGTHLTTQQLQELKDELLRRRSALLEEIAAELPDGVPLGATVDGGLHDEGDAALADLLADLELAEVERHLQELREIEAALARMREHRYGVCVETGEAIPYARLKAQPTALRTVAAQARHEIAEPHPTL